MKYSPVAFFVCFAMVSFLGKGCAKIGAGTSPENSGKVKATPMALPRNTFGDTMVFTDEYWRKNLTPEQYFVLREKGTERPISGIYHSSQGKGTYLCAGCKSTLFSSKAKFDSGTGWPSFYQPVRTDAVIEEPDHSDGTARTEVMCRTCGGHVGHVFPDGPAPTGLRYCLNASALLFSGKE